MMHGWSWREIIPQMAANENLRQNRELTYYSRGQAKREGLAIMLVQGNHRQPALPPGVTPMASTSVPARCGWGNRYSLSIRGAHGLSPCHGGRLRAPFLLG